MRRTLRVAAAIVALTAATVVGSAPASASPFYAVTLNTSTVHPAENGAAVLTAGSNIDVGQTQYGIEIYEVQNQDGLPTYLPIRFCSTGYTCATAPIVHASSYHYYVAYIASLPRCSICGGPPRNIQATATLGVTWGKP